MEKRFYVLKNAETDEALPEMDRFKRIDELNNLLEKGWTIKEFCDESKNAYFVLGKNEA